MVIRPTDRVERVLEQNESLVEVFAAASPHFERLRNPTMRRVMARIVTVEQAARIAGIASATLVERLNAAVRASKPPDAHHEGAENTTEEAEPAQPPAILSRVGDERILDVDVREDLRRGEEPFSRIMAARRALPWGHVLRLRAVFEPVPLYQVLAKQGFAHWTEKLAEDDWRVWFYRPVEMGETESEAVAEGGPSLPANVAAPPRGEEDVRVLDVRGLDPPEPLVRTLAALETLPAGTTLVQLNVRVPQFLLPRLDQLGFEYEIREQGEDLVRLFIRRRAG